MTDLIEQHGDMYDAWLASQGVVSERAKLKAEVATLRASLAACEAALTIIADMATDGPSAHPGNALRQIGDVARKAMEAGQ